MSGNWIATYRLQLHAGFPLPAAQRVLGYLAELGISHVYLSPCLQAVPGSQHGYDVVDPGKISDDLGGEAAWVEFVRAARELDLRILLDVVPNHMSASHHNPWWDDVLKQGSFSAFADFFDNADDFMSKNSRAWIWPASFVRMNVRAADGRHRHPHQNFATLRRPHRKLFQHERRVRRVVNGGLGGAHYSSYSLVD